MGTFASTLRHRRTALKLSLAQLADRVGCAKSYLSSMENGHKGPPADALIDRLEMALSFQDGELFACARWDQTPGAIREDLAALRLRDESVSKLARVLSEHARGGVSLDELYESGELAELIGAIDPGESGGACEVGQGGSHDFHESHESHESSDSSASDGLYGSCDPSIGGMLPMEVPLINKVPAGKPRGFTDLGYPARVADEYVRAPNLSDPDAFAAKVVGDSMEPSFHEGDIVVFSPAKEVSDGMDCFVRFEDEDESTFKRVYFQTDEDGNEMIRIQPINNRYPPTVVPREAVAGLYAGVSVTRSIG
ncbi:MAG: helix-turn-helix domain-containing protein [Phycisphaerales bacterium]